MNVIMGEHLRKLIDNDGGLKMLVSEITTKKKSPDQKPMDMKTVHIDMKVIKILQMDISGNRQAKRKLARAYKMEWPVYQEIQKEYRRRVALGLNIETGKKKQSTVVNNNKLEEVK